MHRRTFSALALATPALWLARPALAREPEIYQKGGIAIDGSDPVGYFTTNGPVSGDAAFTVNHKGAEWRFADQGSADAFAANPSAYEPAFGGYCAWAVSQGYIAPTVPEAWTIHNDKLYLNFSLSVRRRFERNLDANIAKAEANWPGVLG